MSAAELLRRRCSARKKIRVQTFGEFNALLPEIHEKKLYICYCTNIVFCNKNLHSRAEVLLYMYCTTASLRVFDPTTPNKSIQVSRENMRLRKLLYNEGIMH